MMRKCKSGKFLFILAFLRGKHRQRGGAGLSIASDHPGDSGTGRRSGRCARPSSRRDHAGIAGPADRHRKRRRRERDDWHLPRRAGSSRRLHAHSGQLEQPDGGKRLLSCAIRHSGRFRADLIGCRFAALVDWEARFSREGCRGADRVAESQSQSSIGLRASAPGARRTSVAFISRTSPGRSSSSCSIAAAAPPTRIWWAGMSTSCAPKDRAPCRFCATERSRHLG